jgi:hypothetical protein
VIGLVILGLTAGWVVLWLYVFKKARNRAEHVVAVLAAVLIPFWDLPIGYFQYRHHCSNDGGLRVYEKIAPQDKIYFESTPSSFPEDMLKQGFKVVEILRVDRTGIARQEVQRGRIVSRTVTNPESMVAVSILRNEELAWNIYRDRHVARSISGNQLIATYTMFSWHGGWLQRSVWPLFRGSLDCFRGPGNPLVTLLLRGN